MPQYSFLRPATVLMLLSGALAFGQPQGYMDQEALGQTLSSVAAHDHATLSTIGTSLGGAPIHLLTLSGSQEPEQRPALLIVAGLDGEYLVSTETATRIAQLMLADHADVLEYMTMYIVPRANPDGAARNMNPISVGHSGNVRLVDEDRDRLIDEDLPDDLNGDGLITMMRRLEPSLDDAPTHLADPDEPRLNIEPDAKENQRAVFTLYPEGLDNDEDGLINEDGFGSVDLNMNFMHMWPEHAPHAGQYPLSEPESMALAQFVLAHENIIAAITLGKHDNLVNQPDSKSKDITGRTPKGIDAKDVELYKQAGDWLKDSTGVQTASKVDAAGSFHAWIYAQRGLPSFAVQPWTRPGEVDEDNQQDQQAAVVQDNNEPQLTPSPVGDISMETLDELSEAYRQMTGEEPDETMISQITPEMVEQFAAQAGIEVRRVTAIDEQAEMETESIAKDKKKSKKKLSDDAKWLAYFDKAGITGFVDWVPFDHPMLGKVEIGGFVPGVRVNPPSELLDDLAAKHTDFVLKVIEAQPSVVVDGPELTDLGSGIYELRIAIINNGDMPTTTVFSRTTRSIKPVVVRLSVGVDRIISGQRVDRVWGIDAHGNRSEHHWIFRSDDISKESIEILDPRFGNQTIQLGR